MMHALGNDLAMIVTDRPLSSGGIGGVPVHVLRIPPLVAPAGRRSRTLNRVLWRHYELNRLKRLLAQSEVTAVLVHFLNVALKYSEALESCGKPVWVHCHGFDVTWDMCKYDGTPQHPTDYVDRVLALPAHVSFIANSHTTAARLDAIGIDPRRVQVKYLGTPAAQEPRRHLGNSDCTIVYVGRLVDCKGPDVVIQAFDLAVRHGLRGRLVMAGDGPLGMTCRLLKARCAYPEEIEMLGAVDAAVVRTLLGQADIFTAHNCTGPITGQEEAFGVSIVEAMATGLPIVSGNSGSLPEVVRDGMDGILVNPGDVDAHANALLQLAASPEMRNSMGAQGWQRALSMFGLEQELQTLRRILSLPNDSF